MKFGFNQVIHPTPDQLKKVFNTFFATTSIIALALQCFPQIPQHANDVINQWVVSSNTFVFGITRMFGISAKPPGQ